MTAGAHQLLFSFATHMAWADATVWAAVLAHDAASHDDEIRRTALHLHFVQHLYAGAWQGQTAVAMPDASAFPTAGAVAAYGREGHAAVEAFLSAVAPDRIDEPFREPWTDRFEARWQRGPAAAHSLGESIAQVVLHTAHHRGQLCTRLRALGAEPPTVDFILWAWGGRPAPAWPGATGASA